LAAATSTQCAVGDQALTLVAEVQHVGNLARIERLAARAMKTGATTGRQLHRDIQIAKVDAGLWERA
jgi:uncharacterized membrane protein